MQKILNEIKNSNGQAMLVGGSVIKYAQTGKLPTGDDDWDIEVYGLSYSQLEAILTKFGKPSLVGKAFGIIKLKYRGTSYDFSIPRLENFEINLTPYEAGLRRDLTINSMYLDLHTMELIDPFNGLDDLSSGILRVVNSDTFIEDPLRVLRIMQLLPRKGKRVDPLTMELCRSMVTEFKFLSKERVFEEFKKLLLLAPIPSIGLQFLKDSGWITHFPELENLIGSPQNPLHHPEGDVWVHTLWCVDNAALLLEYIPEDWKLAFMFGALCHDLGKPITLDPANLTNYGHDMAGGPLAETFMKRLTDEVGLIKKVRMLTEMHMLPGQLHKSGAKDAAWKRLHNKCRLDVLAYLSRADSAARYGRLLNQHPVSEMALSWFEKLGAEKIKPVVTGKDLIELGYAPGIDFGNILKRCYEFQIENNIDIDSKEAILKEIL